MLTHVARPPAVSHAFLAVFTVIAALGSGCRLEVGVGAEADEPQETEADPVVEVAPCEVADCELFCTRGGSCAYEWESPLSECINDCLDVCDDGWSDDGDAAVMECVTSEYPDVWCEDGLLETCCHEQGGYSDLCEP